MAAASGSVAKLYRFPPTRELHTDYDTVVPAAQGRRRCARELEEYLRRREEAAVDGENLTSVATSLHLSLSQRQRWREIIQLLYRLLKFQLM